MQHIYLMDTSSWKGCDPDLISLEWIQLDHTFDQIQILVRNDQIHLHW